jgi:SNF2 family DNA or RNA helicase
MSFKTQAKKGGSGSSKRFVPHNYQKKAIKFMVERGAAGLFLDPGLGKTSITLFTIMLLLAKNMITKVLVIAPLRVCYSTWPTEVKKWKEFSHLRTSIIHGGPKAREKALEEDADIYIMNPEGLAWLEKQKGWHFDMLVVDESSKFRRSNSQRFKTMKRLVKKFPRRYILTGTPAPNGLEGLFGQIYLLDLGGALGKYITQYRTKYFYPTGYMGREWKIQKGSEEKIYDAIRPLVLRMDAEDYLELPPLVVNDVIVDLPDNVKTIYKEIEKNLVAQIKNGEVVAANSAVASQKCRQVANGGVYFQDEVDPLAAAIEHFKGTANRTKNREWEELHLTKAEAVKDLIDELEGQPALVAYEFGHDLERLKKVLGKDTPHIGGGVSPKKSQKIIDAWNRGELPVLLGQPTSMSHGLNMQDAGRAVIYHSMIWDLEAYEQFYKRVWRQGQKDPVFLYHIIANCNIDFAVRNALKSKHRTQKALLDAFRELV